MVILPSATRPTAAFLCWIAAILANGLCAACCIVPDMHLNGPPMLGWAAIVLPAVARAPNGRLAYADTPLIPLRVGSNGLNACLQRTLCLPLNPLQDQHCFLLLPTNRMVQVYKTLNAPISKSRKNSPQVQVVPGEKNLNRISKNYHPLGTARGKMVELGGLGPPHQAQPCAWPDRLPHRDRCPSLPAWCCGSSGGRVYLASPGAAGAADLGSRAARAMTCTSVGPAARDGTWRPCSAPTPRRSPPWIGFAPHAAFGAHALLARGEPAPRCGLRRWRSGRSSP